MFCMKYWARLEKLEKHDILHTCLSIQKELHKNKQGNWLSKIENIISYYNIDMKEDMSYKQIVTTSKISIYTKEQEKIMSGIMDTNLYPKLRTYRQFKTDFRLEPYLTLNTNKKIYTKIARFRCSSHNLKVETGRHERPITPLINRICDKCSSNETEDELHCLIICSSHEHQRSILFDTTRKFISNFDALSRDEKFKAILQSREPDILRALGNFLNKAI